MTRCVLFILFLMCLWQEILAQDGCMQGFPEIKPLSDWVNLMNKIENDFKKKNQRGYELLCQEAKDTAKRMQENNLQIDVGLGSDVGTDQNYAKTYFSKDPYVVSMIDKIYLECFNSAKKPACTGVKHFPGIGKLTKDPHHSESNQVFKRRDLIRDDYRPFFVAREANACTVMISHSYFQGDSGETKMCTFNPECIDSLKNDIGYDDLIITDEILVMDATIDGMLEIKYPKLLRQCKASLKPDEKKHPDIKRLYVGFCIAKELAQTRFPNGYNDKDIESLYEEVTDIYGIERTIMAIEAGNDMIMQFRVPDERGRKGMHETLKGLVSAIDSKRLDIEKIKSSVRKILKHKEKYFGFQEISKKFKNAKSIEDMINQMSNEDLVKQMIMIDGRWANFQMADKLSFGGVYAPSKDKVAKQTKIPFLRFGDHEYGGNNQLWGKQFKY